MINILYIGYEPKTISYLLGNKRYRILSVAKLYFFNAKTVNPVNILYYFLYYVRLNNKKSFNAIEYLLYRACYFLEFATTGVYRRYREYLLTLSRNKIQVWDLSAVNSIDRIRVEIDLIVVNIWELLDKKIFTAPRFGSINIHPSKLPKNIGAVPTLWSLKNKEKESAVSYIYITDKGIDVGDIIRQDIFPIYDGDNIINIEERVLSVIKGSINDVIETIIDNKVVVIKQDLTQSTKTPKYEIYREIKPEVEKKDDIVNKVRGYPYVIYGEHCYLLLDNRKIYLKNIHILAPDSHKNMFSLVFKCFDGIYLYTNLFIDVSIVESIFIIFNKFKK